MAERIAVGDLVHIVNYALAERFPMGMEASSTNPVRVVALEGGLVRVSPQVFDKPFHPNELTKVEPPPDEPVVTPEPAPATRAKR